MEKYIMLFRDGEVVLSEVSNGVTDTNKPVYAYNFTNTKSYTLNEFDNKFCSDSNRRIVKKITVNENITDDVVVYATMTAYDNEGATRSLDEYVAIEFDYFDIEKESDASYSYEDNKVAIYISEERFNWSNCRSFADLVYKRQDEVTLKKDEINDSINHTIEKINDYNNRIKKIADEIIISCARDKKEITEEQMSKISYEEFNQYITENEDYVYDKLLSKNWKPAKVVGTLTGWSSAAGIIAGIGACGYFSYIDNVKGIVGSLVGGLACGLLAGWTGLTVRLNMNSIKAESINNNFKVKTKSFEQK